MDSVLGSASMVMFSAKMCSQILNRYPLGSSGRGEHSAGRGPTGGLQDRSSLGAQAASIIAASRMQENACLN